MSSDFRRLLNAYLAGRLKMVRLARGLGRDEVAKRTGIPKETYKKLESGRRLLQLDHLVRLAAGWRGSIDEIFSIPDFRQGNGAKVDPERLSREFAWALRRESENRIGPEDILSVVSETHGISVDRLRQPITGEGPDAKSPEGWLEACAACTRLAREFDVPAEHLAEAMNCIAITVYQRRRRFEKSGKAKRKEVAQRLAAARRMLVDRLAKRPRKRPAERGHWLALAVDWAGAKAGAALAASREEAYLRLDDLIRRAWEPQAMGPKPAEATARREDWRRSGRSAKVEILEGRTEVWAFIDGSPEDDEDLIEGGQRRLEDQ